VSFRASVEQPRLSRTDRRWLDGLSDDQLIALVRGLVRVERAVRASRQQQPTTFDPPARRRA
jgi:hypothetical protein